MGPSINGLDDLLKMPYGCGEQNMLNFAPNIFITRYLEITNNLDEATMEKSKGFMVKGMYSYNNCFLLFNQSFVIFSPIRFAIV